MAELADATALGAVGVTCGGSNPSVRTTPFPKREMVATMDKVSLMNCARARKRRAHDERIREKAREAFRRYHGNPLFLSGIALYWAEGTRMSAAHRKYQLALTNSDHNLLRFYCRFLRRYFEDIDSTQWRVGLFLYPDIDVKEAVSFWSRSLDIPGGQFIKPQILRSGNRADKKLEFGTCCVYVNSKDACIGMQTWIQCISGITSRKSVH